MTDHAWRTAWERWGDQLWSLALVRWGNRARAQRALVSAFAHVYATKTPPTDAHTVLLQAILLPRRRVLSFTRSRDLPRPLRGVPPVERALLALWLVQNGKGDQLAMASGWTHQALVQRLARALLPFLPRRDPARRTDAGQAAFAHWLEQQLNLFPPPLPDTIAEATIVGWQQALNRARDLFSTVERQRVPSTARAAIEAALTLHDDETPAWQQRLVWLALAALLLAAAWILRSPAAAQSPPSTATPPASVDARTVVENAIDTWITMPVSGTLHRRVWAIEPSIPEAPALVTDVWLSANSPRYRVETMHDGRLVEWQFGDGTGELQYAARSIYSACRWGDGPSTRAALVFNADAAQQQAVRDARLQQGAYGRGYQMLQTALRAPDLRSWGARTENGRPVLMLGYSDPAQVGRERMLVFDGHTRQLQAVRELVSDGTQTAARDLWRVEHEESLGSDVSTTPPSRPGARRARSRVFDPTCLDLDGEYLLSLRALVGSDTGWWLPTRLPPDVEAAAIISNDVVTPQTVSTWQWQSATARAVFVGGERVLGIRAERTFVNLDGSVARGPWRVVFNGDQHTIHAKLCRPPAGFQACPPDEPSLAIEAQGWTEDQILDLIDSLAPASAPSTWQALDTLFVDPQPLDPQVQQVLAQALNRTGVEQGVIHSTAEITHTPVEGKQGDVVVDPFADTVLADPYAVPKAWLEPEHVSVEHTVVVSDGIVQQARATMQGHDGTLLYARVMNDASMVQYDGLDQTASTTSMQEQTWMHLALRTQRAQIFECVQAFASSMLPITLRDAGDMWVLQQATSDPNPYQLDMLLRRFVPYTENTGAGSYVEHLWIDKQTGLLRRAEVVQNRDTVVSALHVNDWRVEPVAAQGDLQLPPLPSDTIAYTYGDFGPTVTSDLAPFLPPQREWVWRDGFEVVHRSDRSRPFEGFAANMLNTNVDHLEAVGLIHGTTYRVPNSRAPIMVRQGAAPLLRYALRLASLSYDGSSGWNQSRAVPVSIGGQKRTAWLLEDYTETALVVEIDGVIVHISSSDTSYIGGALLDALPQLELVDAAEWKGNP